MNNAIFDKNGVVFEGNRRFYKEDLAKRDYNLEFTSPHSLAIEGTTICENVWGEMIRSLVIFLFSKYPDKKETASAFQAPWSKQQIITQERRTNSKMIFDHLWLNCNHTALHSCWLIQDLLDYFSIPKEKVIFLIHRPSAAEPEEVVDVIRKSVVTDFKKYLTFSFYKSENSANIIVSNINKILNPLLARRSKSYNDLFLFDSSQYASNYINLIKPDIDGNLSIDEKTRKTLNRYLDYLLGFYRLIIG